MRSAITLRPIASPISGAEHDRDDRAPARPPSSVTAVALRNAGLDDRLRDRHQDAGRLRHDRPARSRAPRAPTPAEWQDPRSAAARGSTSHAGERAASASLCRRCVESGDRHASPASARSAARSSGRRRIRPTPIRPITRMTANSAGGVEILAGRHDQLAEAGRSSGRTPPPPCRPARGRSPGARPVIVNGSV